MFRPDKGHSVKIPIQIGENTIRGMAFGLILSVLILAGAEHGAAWVEQNHMPDPMTPGLFESPHPHLLWELPPGETEVNEQHVLVNSIGARGKEVGTRKAPNSRRIVFLGDNVTFGQGVELADTFAFDAVKSLGGPRVGLEAVMLAVPDYTAMQHLNLMNMRGWKLAPDLLVIGGPSAEMAIQPYVDAEVITPTRAYSGPRSILESSALFRVMDHWANLYKNEKAQIRTRVFIGGQNANINGRPRMTTNEYARTLDRLVEDALERSIVVVFVMLPVAEDLDDSHLSDTHFLYRQAMTAVATRHGIPVIDGPEAFKNSQRSTGRLFLNHTLLSEAGHRTLGYALARRIKPWMRGRKILLQGTGGPLPTLPETELQPTQP